MELTIAEISNYEENNLKTMNENKGQNPSVKKDECVELKNIKYKTMLLTGVHLKETRSANNLSNLDKFLDNEKTNNKNEQWCKLDKTMKCQKLMIFVENYKNENNLDDESALMLSKFFKECLDKKKLSHVKDVVYDKITGEIKEIPSLFYSKKHFTLRNVDKHVSATKNLTPKKVVKPKNKTIKGKDETIEEEV